MAFSPETYALLVGKGGGGDSPDTGTVFDAVFQFTGNGYKLASGSFSAVYEKLSGMNPMPVLCAAVFNGAEGDNWDNAYTTIMLDATIMDYGTKIAFATSAGDFYYLYSDGTVEGPEDI